MSEWVSEAQRIAREAAEVTAKELLCRANHAMGWLVEGCPGAAQLVLESMVLRRPPPDSVMLAEAAERDRKRNETKSKEVALNERIAEARDAALEEAANEADRARHGVVIDDKFGTYKSACFDVARRIRALKERK